MNRNYIKKAILLPATGRAASAGASPAKTSAAGRTAPAAPTAAGKTSAATAAPAGEPIS